MIFIEVIDMRINTRNVPIKVKMILAIKRKSWAQKRETNEIRTISFRIKKNCCTIAMHKYEHGNMLKKTVNSLFGSDKIDLQRLYLPALFIKHSNV